jgi:hypothetical protein
MLFDSVPIIGALVRLSRSGGSPCDRRSGCRRFLSTSLSLVHLPIDDFRQNLTRAEFCVSTDVGPLVRKQGHEALAEDPEVRDVARQLDLACRHMGFFYVVRTSTDVPCFLSLNSSLLFPHFTSTVDADWTWGFS